jgi:hypothetical protein
MPKFTASLNLPQYATAPATPSNGDVYYNTTASKAYARVGGAWVEIGGAGGGVTSITGTANQVVASASTGAVTLSLPQSIATTSTPQFNRLKLTGEDPYVSATVEGEIAYRRDEYSRLVFNINGTETEILPFPEANTANGKGIVALSTSTNDTSTTLAATPSAVKSAYDLANAAVRKSTVTTKGDVIVASGNAAVARLGIGTDGQVLTADAASTNGVKWATSGTGTTSSATPLSVAATAVVGTSTIPSRQDHVHSGVTSITGTANQVVASASTGAVTLSLPQSIDTSSSPTFGNGSFTGSIGFNGALYPTTSLSGPSLDFGGTNGRQWQFGGADIKVSLAGTQPGCLIVKSCVGQPTTTVNGAGTSDVFADVVTNGGTALDNTNTRFYVYTGGAWRYSALTTPSDSRLKEEITSISGAIDTLRQLVPVAFKWKRPEAHQRTDSVDDNGKRLGFIADQVATTDLKHWVEDMGVGDIERDLADDTDGRVLAVNIPQNEMEALVVQALLDIDTRLKALENK